MDTSYTMPDATRIGDDSRPVLVQRDGCGWRMECPPSMVRMPCTPTREQAVALWEAFAKAYHETVS